MTDNGILLEYEMFLAAKGETKVVCPRCGYTTYRDTCMFCSDKQGKALALTGAKELEDLEQRLNNGEDVNLTEFFSMKKDVEFAEEEEKFEPVKLEDIEDTGDQS